MPFKSASEMGAREVAWAFYLTCGQGWADYFDVKDCTYDPENDVVHVGKPAVLEAQRQEGGYTQGKVQAELSKTLELVRAAHPGQYAKLEGILRDRDAVQASTPPGHDTGGAGPTAPSGSAPEAPTPTPGGVGPGGDDGITSATPEVAAPEELKVEEPAPEAEEPAPKHRSHSKKKH